MGYISMRFYSFSLKRVCAYVCFANTGSYYRFDNNIMIIIYLISGKTKELRNCTTLYFALNSTKDETKLTLKIRENFMVSLWHFLAVPSMYCYDLGQTKSTTNLCPGVSGSPLIRFNELWGIASFSFPICDCNEIYFYCFIDFFAAQKWLKTYIKVKQ